LYQALKILTQQELGLVMLLSRGFWHSNQPHDRTHRSRLIASTVHDFAHIKYEVLYGLLEFFLFWHIGNYARPANRKKIIKNGPGGPFECSDQMLLQGLVAQERSAQAMHLICG